MVIHNRYKLYYGCSHTLQDALQANRKYNLFNLFHIIVILVISLDVAPIIIRLSLILQSVTNVVSIFT